MQRTPRIKSILKIHPWYKRHLRWLRFIKNQTAIAPALTASWERLNWIHNPPYLQVSSLIFSRMVDFKLTFLYHFVVLICKVNQYAYDHKKDFSLYVEQVFRNRFHESELKRSFLKEFYWFSIFRSSQVRR
jgi:hypothetical protein